MKELFETLYNIDVTKMKEKKGKFDYVSWPNAWRILATSDIVKSFEYKTIMDQTSGLHYFKDQDTKEVYIQTELTINGMTIRCQLPVTDFNNSPVKNPQMNQIINTEKRCLVKNIALFGLGLDLWIKDALSDLDATEKNQKPVSSSINKSKPRTDTSEAPAKGIKVDQSLSRPTVEASLETKEIEPPSLESWDDEFILQDFGRTTNFWEGTMKYWGTLNSADALVSSMKQYRKLHLETNKQYTIIGKKVTKFYTDKYKQLQ